MQDTSPRTGADCLQEERASVFQLKELFFPPPLFFFPFLLYCECVTLRSDPRRIPEWQLSPFTVLLAAQPADRSWLSWDQEGRVQVSVAAFYHSPSAPFRHTWVTLKKRPPPKKKHKREKQHRKQKCKHNSPQQQKSSGEKNQKQANRGKKALAFHIKLFKDRVSFFLFWWLSL